MVRDGDRATEALDDFPGDGKTQPHTRDRLSPPEIDPKEGLENPADQFVRNARAFIADYND